MFQYFPKEINRIISEYVPVKINEKHKYVRDDPYKMYSVLWNIEDVSWNVNNIRQLEEMVNLLIYGIKELKKDIKMNKEILKHHDEESDIYYTSLEIRGYEDEIELKKYGIKEIHSIINRLYTIRYMRRLGSNANGEYDPKELKQNETIRSLENLNNFSEDEYDSDFYDSDSE